MSYRSPGSAFGRSHSALHSSGGPGWKAFYELATNAAKYGALSSPTGHLEVIWHVVTAAYDHDVEIVWSESGMNMPEPPAREGFGTGFIKRGIQFELNGAVKMAFERSGLECTIRFPFRGNTERTTAIE